jgi:chromosome segregation ATPase
MSQIEQQTTTPKVSDEQRSNRLSEAEIFLLAGVGPAYGSTVTLNREPAAALAQEVLALREENARLMTERDGLDIPNDPVLEEMDDEEISKLVARLLWNRKQLQAEVWELQERVSELEDQLQVSGIARRQLEDSLREANSTIMQQNGRAASLEQKVQELTSDLDKTRHSLATSSIACVQKEGEIDQLTEKVQELTTLLKDTLTDYINLVDTECDDAEMVARLRAQLATLEAGQVGKASTDTE